ncbi:hypothetical protein Dsin_009281 [Dipteronia sinensis]|uniref:Reverse transcriptase n=1 Tax=Dipteronia sinensis TaxID=43782 RepID=A0AAE0AQC1_9ROSI|nr:hypothetical protein Dsin_009281 [Dipteronia sinensis]
MSYPSSWSGFDANSGKLKIEQDDIWVSDGPGGPMMKLSPKLKEQLHKPWANALIFKNMGRAHTLSFMTTEFSQKWALSWQWQLTDLGEDMEAQFCSWRRFDPEYAYLGVVGMGIVRKAVGKILRNEFMRRQWGMLRTVRRRRYDSDGGNRKVDGEYTEVRHGKKDSMKNGKGNKNSDGIDITTGNKASGSSSQQGNMSKKKGALSEITNLNKKQNVKAGKRIKKITKKTDKLGIKKAVSQGDVSYLQGSMGMNGNYQDQHSSFLVKDSEGQDSLLWNGSDIRIQVIASSRHTISALVADHKTLWVFTVVYVNPCVNYRRNIWSYLDSVRGCFNFLWLVIGDFNEIIYSSEKSGGRCKFSKSGFTEWIDKNIMVDMGYIGSKFTWMTKREQEEIFWKQKSRNCWLKEGDKNTKFFHLSTVVRMRRNKLEGLKKDDGSWIEKIEEMKGEAVQYFTNLLEEKQSLEGYSQIPVMFSPMERGNVKALNARVSEEEVKQGLFHIGGLKALGPDGFPAIFFQRPISLCNTYYKVVSKVVVQRLRHIIPSLISPNHVAFVPGRQIQNNIIVAQEVLHKFKRAKGKMRFIARKIDLAKAYDRLQWGFIKAVLDEAGIEDFRPNSVIRQGDSLSPYIFVLCMEELSHIIHHKLNEGTWKPIKISRNGPAISHLFFVDDLILFGQASMQQAQVMKDCIDMFYDISGQQGLSNNGDFSIKSAYESLFKSEDMPNWQWNVLWKLRLPPTVQTFIWTVLHGKILTIEHRATRGLTMDTTCSRCKVGCENLNHVFRGCSASTEIWEDICKGITKTEPFNLEWCDWMSQNLRCNTMIMGKFPAYLIFAVTIEDWIIANCNVVNKKKMTTCLIAWIPPKVNRIKLNVDGSLNPELGTISAGGVIRNHLKSWIGGFAVNRGNDSIIEVELWGIFKGLQIMWKAGFKKVEVESDSRIAVCLLTNSTPTNHPIFSIIHSCKALMDNNWCCKIRHVYREGNRFADNLAKLGHSLEVGITTFGDPPSQILGALEDDFNGLVVARCVLTS